MIEALAVTFGFVLARVGVFVAVLPLLDGAKTPRIIKAGLALALTIFHFTLQDGAVSQELLAQAGKMSWFSCALVLLREAILGAFLGYAMGLVLLPVQVAGHYLGQEMGLSLGQLSGLTTNDSSTVVSSAFETLAALLLLGLDGHHLFLATLHGTFVRFPIGAGLGSLPVGDMVTGLARSQEWGLLLAAPLGAALFITTVVLALMNRAVPQLNLFSVGFSLRVGVGLVGAFLLFPEFVRGLLHVFGHFSALLRGLV